MSASDEKVPLATGKELAPGTNGGDGKRRPPKMERTRYPGIFKRGSKYVVTWRYGGSVKKESFRTIGEAKAAQGRRRQQDGRRPDTNERFEDYARRWMETYRGRTGRGLADSTRESYQRAMRVYAIPFFGRRKLASIEPPDIRRFITHLEKKRGLKPGSVRRAVAPLKVMFATAVEDGALRFNPCSAVRIGGQQDRTKIKALTREELQVVLAALPEQWQPFFSFLAQTGVRISEALALTWGDVELGVRPTVHVTKQRYRGTLGALKSDHSVRDIPLSDSMAATLRIKRAAEYTGDDRPLWATQRGKPLHANNVRHRVMLPALEPIGFSWVHYHTFRHTCASLLFASGKNVKQVQRWLGHADPGFTMRTYVHLVDEGVGDASCFDGLGSGPLPEQQSGQQMAT